MCEIICMFIKAERTGNFLLHLQSIWEMLQCCAASGHMLYARSEHIYLQDNAKSRSNQQKSM